MSRIKVRVAEAVGGLFRVSNRWNRTVSVTFTDGSSLLLPPLATHGDFSVGLLSDSMVRQSQRGQIKIELLSLSSEKLGRAVNPGFNGGFS